MDRAVVAVVVVEVAEVADSVVKVDGDRAVMVVDMAADTVRVDMAVVMMDTADTTTMAVVGTEATAAMTIVDMVIINHYYIRDDEFLSARDCTVENLFISCFPVLSPRKMNGNLNNHFVVGISMCV